MPGKTNLTVLAPEDLIKRRDPPPLAAHARGGWGYPPHKILNTAPGRTIREGGGADPYKTHVFSSEPAPQVLGIATPGTSFRLYFAFLYDRNSGAQTRRPTATVCPSAATRGSTHEAFS